MAILRRCGLILWGCVLASGALADRSSPGDLPLPASAAADWQFKLTPTYLATPGAAAATDWNLRANNGPHALWLAYYRQPGQFAQARTGYEFTQQWSYLKLVPSLQAASHGFFGASLNAEIGGPLYVLLGVGRTNTRPYYNLNIDPNDMQTYGLGWHWSPQTTLAVYSVRDDRLQTGQRINHALFRQQLDALNRLTLDLFSKHGQADADSAAVKGDGLALTWDHASWFVRVAHEQKVGFTTRAQNRFSLGWRF